MHLRGQEWWESFTGVRLESKWIRKQAWENTGLRSQTSAPVLSEDRQPVWRNAADWGGRKKKKVLKPVHRLNLSERAKSETERHKGQMEAGVFEWVEGGNERGLHIQREGVYKKHLSVGERDRGGEQEAKVDVINFGKCVSSLSPLCTATMCRALSLKAGAGRTWNKQHRTFKCNLWTKIQEKRTFFPPALWIKYAAVCQISLKTWSW